MRKISHFGFLFFLIFFLGILLSAINIGRSTEKDCLELEQLSPDKRPCSPVE